MLRLPDYLTNDNLGCYRLKLLPTCQPLYCIFIENVCQAYPKGDQIVCCAGPMRVSYTDFSLCSTIWLVVLPVVRIDGSSPSVKKKVTIFN